MAQAPVPIWDSTMQYQRRAHLVGICGAGMRALAEALHDSGWIVSGCDRDADPFNQSALRRLEIPVVAGHAAAHVSPELNVLIHSPAIPPEHVERMRAVQLGIPQISYVDALAQLFLSRTGIAIAGTHGKSTTTGMAGAILDAAQLRATVICGAEMTQRRRNGWAGDGPLLVAEACEFRRHFTAFRPHVSCVLNIEPDHFDCYPQLADAEAAYLELIARTDSHGAIVFHADCPAVCRVINRAAQAETPSARRISFSASGAKADWGAADLQFDRGCARFLLAHESRRIAVVLQVPGRHQVENALAAAACADAVGVSLEAIAAGLSGFQGLSRRFEVLPRRDGRIVIDDYAHHPTEIRATLKAARAAYPGQELLAIFQPHQMSRTEALLQEFADALSEADRICILPVFAAREIADSRQRELPLKIIDLIQKAGRDAGLIETLDQVWPTVETDADSGAVVLTLGAGNLTRIHHEFT